MPKPEEKNENKGNEANGENGNAKEVPEEEIEELLKKTFSLLNERAFVMEIDDDDEVLFHFFSFFKRISENIIKLLKCFCREKNRKK